MVILQILDDCIALSSLEVEIDENFAIFEENISDN